MENWLLVVFTAISALAACFACAISAWGYRLNNRPEVVVFLDADTDSGYVYLCIGNYGNRTAHNITVSLSEIPPLECADDREHLERFIDAGISALPPGLVRKGGAGPMSDDAYSDPSKEYLASVEYSRRRKWCRRIREEYSLDFRSSWEAVEYRYEYYG